MTLFVCFLTDTVCHIVICMVDDLQTVIHSIFSYTNVDWVNGVSSCLAYSPMSSSFITLVNAYAHFQFAFHDNSVAF